MIKNKRGYYFSIDAFVALIIILGIVFFFKPTTKEITFESSVHQDLLDVLSNLQIGEIDNSYARVLISSGDITNLNQSVLDQIGEFYAKSDPNAQLLAQSILDDLNINENLGLYFDHNLIAKVGILDVSNSTRIIAARQIISGIQNGSSAKGYSSRAFLSSGNRVKYFYFGGYIGDGNISARIDGDIIGGEIEGIFGGNFSLYINNLSAGNYAPAPDVPYKISLANHTNKFINGANIFEFKSKNNLYIAGGFIRVNFNQTLVNPLSAKNYLPGVDGLINLYDGIYVPGILNSMNISLHYNSTYDVFLKIGDTTVYEGNSSGNEVTVNFDDGYLSNLFSYIAFFSYKTVPLRIGLKNVSFFNPNVKGVDAISVTDISGSMSGTPLTNAKAANRVFIDSILNSSMNQVGLSAYNTSVYQYNTHDLSKDGTSLKNKVNSWIAWGGTCICCGINDAVNKLNKIYYNQSVLSGPIAYYKFNGSSSDSSPNGKNLTIVGNMPYVTGVSGNAINSSGTTGNYSILNPFNGFSSDQITVAFWMKTSDTLNSGTPFSYYTTTDEFEIYNYRSIQIRVKGSSRTTSISANDGLWHHIAVTWRSSDGNVTLYKDGIPVYSNTVAQGLSIINGGSLVLGQDQDSLGGGFSSSESFRGSLDDMRIYSRVLSNAEIQGLNNSVSTCVDNIVQTGEFCDGGPYLCSNGGFNGITQCGAPCSSYGSCDTSYNCGNMIVNTGETCDDGNNQDNDGCSSTCQKEDRLKFMVVMSDGQATNSCFQQGVTGDLNNNSNVDDHGDDAVQAACDAYTDYGIKVYSIAFGSSSDNKTMQAIASCGQGNYYYGDVNDIVSIYANISQQIINASYSEQTVVAQGGVKTKIYSDSYISLDYTRLNNPYGVSITAESDIAGSSSPIVNYFIPNDTIPFEAKVVSYSGTKWTSKVDFNESGSWYEFFKLENYSSIFTDLGDPYILNVPFPGIKTGDNSVRVLIGNSPSNLSDGSQYNKVIYTVIKNISSYSPVVYSANGCSWTIEYEDGTNSIIKVPANYSGSDTCIYSTATKSYNYNDAVQNSIFLLLQDIDLNKNGKIESKLTDQDLIFNSLEVVGIPFTWETEVQTRIWV